jgi:hypothetical protein
VHAKRGSVGETIAADPQDWQSASHRFWLIRAKYTSSTLSTGGTRRRPVRYSIHRHTSSAAGTSAHASAGSRGGGR